MRKDGTPYLPQYKWRCVFRDAYYVCLLLWPFAHTKLPKIQKIIEYYANKKINMDNIVDIANFKRRKNVR